MIGQPAAQGVGSEFFIGRIAVEAVKAGQVNNNDLFVIEMEAADFTLDGGAGEIGGLGSQTGEGVEKGGFTGVWITDRAPG